MSRFNCRRTQDPADRKTVELALGRIFRLASRPTQPGDAAEYEACRRIVMDAVESPAVNHDPNWARDRNRGAAGD